MRIRYNPHPYQEVATQAILDHPAAGLFLDMGLGKTVSTLTAIDSLMFDSFEIRKVLVIAPKRVAELTWPAEIEKWEHLQDLSYSLVLGTARQREAALQRKAHIYIINRENVKWLIEHSDKREWEFDMVVIDELSSFKSTKAARFRSLRKAMPLVSRVVGLTGTPSSNGYEDLWPQIYLLDRGERLGKTKREFLQRYFIPSTQYFGSRTVQKWDLREGAADKITQAIGDICISMKSIDHLIMPELILNEIPVQLEPQERKQYEKLERELLLEYADGDIVATAQAALCGKLLQLANGAVYNEHGEPQQIHDKKIEALKEILEEVETPVLVSYWYKHDRSRLLASFPEAREIDKAKDIDDWNAGRIRLAIIHPASAGHGLNIQAGGNTIVLFGLMWSLELYQQLIARLWRQGQEAKAVIVHHLIAKDTMDEEVIRRLRKKDEVQQTLLEALKARIKKIEY